MLAMQLVPLVCAPALYTLVHIVTHHAHCVNDMDVDHPAQSIELAAQQA